MGNEVKLMALGICPDWTRGRTPPHFSPGNPCPCSFDNQTFRKISLDGTEDRWFCGRKSTFLSPTPTMDTTDDAYYYCTKHFDANPDVSGTGVSTQLKWVESGPPLITRSRFSLRSTARRYSSTLYSLRTSGFIIFAATKRTYTSGSKPYKMG